MAKKSTQEIDFNRLLSKCQLMVNSNKNHHWRIEKYVQDLQNKLNQLANSNTCQIENDVLNNYKKKVNFLKGIIQTEKLSSPSEKLFATQTLSPMISDNNVKRNDRTKEIHLQTQSKYIDEVRDELFGLRRRNPVNNEMNNDDVDVVLKYHQNLQEKVAEEMVSLAQNLKHNCTVSNQIIKKDTETLERAAILAETNYSSLRTNSDRLNDFVKRSCQYWLWIMLAIVSMTFLWIVFFIRVFPKGH